MSRLLLILMLALFGPGAAPSGAVAVASGPMGVADTQGASVLHTTPDNLPSWDDMGWGLLLSAGTEGSTWAPTAPGGLRTASASGHAGFAPQANPLRQYVAAHRAARPHRACRGYLHRIACLRL